MVQICCNIHCEFLDEKQLMTHDTSLKPLLRMIVIPNSYSLRIINLYPEEKYNEFN